MKTVCIDTHILIWGVRKHATPGQEPMIQRAEMFLEYLEKSNARVLVPSIAIGEFLVGVPEERQPVVLEALQDRFRIVDFDPVAAALAAKLWQTRKQLLTASIGSTRDVIKADFQILATAITRKASVLYSHDEELLNMRQNLIAVSKMPEGLAKDRDLFEPH